MMFISYYLGNKYYPIPYDKKKIAGYLSLSTGFSCISFYGFGGNYFVGILLLAIFLGFIYYNEKETLLRILKRPVKN